MNVTGLSGEDRQPVPFAGVAQRPATGVWCPVLAGRESEAAILAAGIRPVKASPTTSGDSSVGRQPGVRQCGTSDASTAT
jgi:hypothetical protein